MLALVEDSKKKATKPDLNATQTGMNIPKVFNLHAQLCDKSQQYVLQLQNEINSDEASIFANKKYKELLKLANAQQSEMIEQFKEQYTLDQLATKMLDMSGQRM